jgi:hypothetical protein
MFPNVRLQIVALFVSVVALSFGFGVFAAFRVNHEPLAQIPASAATSQRGAETAAPPSTWGAPFGSRFWLSETQIHGAADLPALTPIVRHDVTERTMTWVVVTGSVAGTSAPALQPSPAPPDVQSVAAPLTPKHDDPPNEVAAPQAASTAVVGAAEPAAQVKPERVDAEPEHAAQETKPHELPVSAPHKAARAIAPRRHVAARVPIKSQTPQSTGPREEPVVFQTALPPYRPQKDTPVTARSASTTDAPVFQTAPPSQR